MSDGRRVLLTGCGGAVAKRVAMRIAQRWRGARLLGIGRRPDNAFVAETAVVDLTNAPALASLVADFAPDTVIHAAGRVGAADWDALIRDSIEATLNLLEAVSTHTPRARVVVVGSAAEIGLPTRQPVDEAQRLQPLTRYGVSKAWQSIAVGEFASRGVEVCIGRVFNLVGCGTPTSTSLGAFAAQLRDIGAGSAAPVLRVGNLASRRDFVDLDEAADGLLCLAEKGRRGQTYNLCTGRPVSVTDALALMIRLSGLEVRVETDTARLRTGDLAEVYGCPRKTAAECGWRAAVTLDDSLAAMLAE
jgi:GDP-4-dehydro-6-deoxy-D-mannose reductase